MLNTAKLGAAAMAVLALSCAPATAALAPTQTPLASSNYATRAVCPAPTPGYATCMAVALVAKTAQARTYTHPVGLARAIASAAPSPQAGDFGLRPRDLHSAYSLPTNAASAQTIALVDAYNDLTAAEDLAAYEGEFGLHQCTGVSCFTKLNESGQSTNLPFPQTHEALANAETLCKGSENPESPEKRKEREAACREVEEAKHWTVETSLDIETARAVCQTCHIVLVEANSSFFPDLFAAEEAAVHAGATEISDSWGSPECLEAGVCAQEGEDSVFKHPGIVITASTGDEGFENWLEEPQHPYADFPASSPYVVAVGGTRLAQLGPHGEWTGETVWNDGGESEGVKDGHGASGGGCSLEFAAQPWQREVSDWAQVGCENHRAVADVAADGDPYSGVAVHDSSSPECETLYEEDVKGKFVKRVTDWCTIGGTSLASPLIAATFALAGGAHGVDYPAQTLYENTAKAAAAKTAPPLHDVTEGSNGECLEPFDEKTEPGSQPCTPTQEAEKSCAKHLICLATPGAGYDGPSGLGTPDGITAFEPAGEGGSEAPGGKGKPAEPSGAGGAGSAAGAGASTIASGLTSPPGAGSAVSTGARAVQISALALTFEALVALNTTRPSIARVGFTFTINPAAHVRASLQKRAVRHRHARWLTLGKPLAITAHSGRNSARLGGRRTLDPGTYRLTLTPIGGTARSLLFQIG